MQSLLFAENMKSWPIASVAWYAKRTGQVVASLSTWYKYARQFGVSKRRTAVPEKKHHGLVTHTPNQYFHVDTTFYRLTNGVYTAIVFVSDNFSRAILGWSVSTSKGAGNVINALKMATHTIKKHHPGHYSSLLMADLGLENNNPAVENFLDSQKEPELHKIIAQKQVKYSNSSVEAINRIFKGYLRQHLPEDMEGLRHCIRYCISDYNLVRPHISLGGRTPMEVYTREEPEMDFTRALETAKQKRKAENRESNCGMC